VFSRRQAEPEDQPEFSQDAGIDLGVQDFLLEHADRSKGFTIRLFRVYRRPGRKDGFGFLQTWHDIVPEFDEVAAAYGPGEYRFNLIYSDPKRGRAATSRTFAVDPDWGGQRQVQQGPAQFSPGGDPFAAARDARRETIEMMKVFLDAFNNQGKGNGQSDGFLADLQKNLGDIALANFEQQNKLINEVNRSRLALPADDEEEEEAPFVLQAAQWLLAAWRKWGPQIMAAPKQAGAMLKPQIQDNAHVQYALSHPDEYKTLYDTFQKQTGAPEGKINEFVHALGFPTPGELEKEASTQPGQAASAPE